MRKNIVRAPHPTLRKPASLFGFPADQPRAEKFYVDLQDTLVGKEAIGLGLALPQIDKSLQGFATYLPVSANAPESLRPTEDEKETSEFAMYFNPELIDHSESLTFGPDPDDPLLEGCLSIPGFYGPVPRYTSITLSYIDFNFNQRKQTFEGFYARVVQHEFDHLHGILFTDYILKYDLPLYQKHGEKMKDVSLDLARLW